MQLKWFLAKRLTIKEVQAMWIYLLLILTLLVIVLAVQYSTGIRAAYKRLGSYDAKTVDTEFGSMSYVDEGTGEAVLLSHGIFGGYDRPMCH
jgi:hypothetical protein